MTELGLCINAKDAVPDASECAALGLGNGDWVRTHLDGPLSLLDGMLAKIPADVNVMLTLNNQNSEVGWDWSGWENACRIIAAKYAARVRIVGCGNELDLWHWQPPIGNGDPGLTPLFAANLVRRAAPILYPAGIKVAMSSVASGSWPDYLRDMAHLCGNQAAYADLHLYVKALNGIPAGAGWQTAQAAILQARTISGLPVICSEAGIKIDDAGGLQEQANWAAGLGSLPAELVCYFAWRDDVGTGEEQGGQAFGARDPNGHVKPVWFALQSLFGGPANRPPAERHAEFRMGFLDWSRADPARLGTPLEDESGGTPGFSVQRTSTGRLMAQYLADPTTQAIRGWTLTFWEDATGARYLFADGRSEQIA